MKLKKLLYMEVLTSDFHLKFKNCIKKLIVNDEMKDVLAEEFNLIQLVYTIPSTKTSVEHLFSTLERIKTITRSSRNEVRLSAQTLISNEN